MPTITTTRYPGSSSSHLYFCIPPIQSKLHCAGYPDWQIKLCSICLEKRRLPRLVELGTGCGSRGNRADQIDLCSDSDLGLDLGKLLALSWSVAALILQDGWTMAGVEEVWRLVPGLGCLSGSGFALKELQDVLQAVLREFL